MAILDAWRRAAEARLPDELQPPPWPESRAGQRISTALGAWTKTAPRPLVLFLDEIDALQDNTLISVLRQLRDGYPDRPQAFPWSLALIGLHDRLDTSSFFNIKVESLTLGAFTAQEIGQLYQQHTDDTGQVFTPEALRHAFELTQGQPWLVNALARQAVDVLVTDPAQPITAAHMEQAKAILIQRQDTHLDSLAERLREPRVRHVIEPMLAGRALGAVPSDDIRFVLDLGLCRMVPAGGLV
ncbi:MAG: ATP-binding protein, partial [Delftia sp.]|nr:ATP-binding protein [Delftia sp.]